MKGLFYIGFFFVLIGCNNSNEKKLASNKTVSAIFNESEIKDLAMILDFFNERICAMQKNDVASIEKCYQVFFEMMANCEITGVFDIKIPVQERQKLYCQINESTFNQIWRIDHRWYHSYRNEADTIESTENQFVGKYLDFLKMYGNDDSVIELYYDSMTKVGDYSAAIFSGLVQSGHK
jgi:hypothetical protein